MTSILRAPPASAGDERLALFTEWLNAFVVCITVRGDIDAANVDKFRDYVFRRAGNCRSLVVNLRDVTFFGTEGFSALRTIEDRCARAAVNWMVLPSAAVNRVLDICDREFTIPCGAY